MASFRVLICDKDCDLPAPPPNSWQCMYLSLIAGVKYGNVFGACKPTVLLSWVRLNIVIIPVMYYLLLSRPCVLPTINIFLYYTIHPHAQLITTLSPPCVPPTINMFLYYTIPSLCPTYYYDVPLLHYPLLVSYLLLICSFTTLSPPCVLPTTNMFLYYTNPSLCPTYY